jgi:hypothetical protein
MAEFQSLNRYAYALHNPVTYIDPSGHFSLNIHKFLTRAFGDVGTAALGIAVQVFVPIVGPALGTYILTQSPAGRDALAGEIVAATVATAAVCGPCSTTFIGIGGAEASLTTIAQGALIGEITMGALGAESASIYHGDISKGLLEGVVTGAITGAFGGYTNAAFQAPTIGAANFYSDLAKFSAGNFASNLAIDFGSVATVAYAGGRGNLNSIWRGASSNALSGLPIDLASTLGQFEFAQLATGPTIIKTEFRTENEVHYYVTIDHRTFLGLPSDLPTISGKYLASTVSPLLFIPGQLRSIPR